MKLQESGQLGGNVMKRIAAVAIAVLCVAAVAGVISFATGVSSVDSKGTYVSYHTDASGNKRCHEIIGPLKYLNHSCRPNAELGGFRLKALVAIRAGQEITMSYGDDACDCDREAREMERS